MKRRRRLGYPVCLQRGAPPPFHWGALSTATEYHLQVQNDADIVLDEWYPADDITSASRCTVPSPSILSDDDIDYYWRVQASNDAGPGPWSSLKYFEVVCEKSARYGDILSAPRLDKIENLVKRFGIGQ